MIQVTVAERIQLTEQVIALRLVASDGQALPGYAAGAHIDVHLPDGLLRQYSLCASPGADYYEIAVLNDPASRGGSKALHQQVKAGDKLQISAPKNHFALTAAGKTLLLAAGIGITPILAMAEQLAAQQQDFEMHYCAREPQQAAYYDRIRQADWADKVHFHFSQGDSRQRLQIASLLSQPPSDCHLYVCGPVGFIEDVLSNAAQANWPAEQVHREFFSAAPIDHSHDESFEVQIQSSGQILKVPADCSILNVLEDHGIFIPVSCEEGVCGTCATGLLSGEADHKDVFLTDQEKQRMDLIMPCCSRACSKRLVLDL